MLDNILESDQLRALAQRYYRLYQCAQKYLSPSPNS